MTPLDRALQKAYARKPTVARESVRSDSTSAVNRGWVPKLRTPVTTVDGSTGAAREPTSHAADLSASNAQPAGATAELQPIKIAPGDDDRGKVYRVDPSPQSPPTPPETVPPISAAWHGPPICNRLLDAPTGPGIRELAGRLSQLLKNRSLRSLAFTGPDRSAGRTSLLLTVARVLIEQTSLRMLLIDLDCEHPELASLLSAAPKGGLWQAACGLIATSDALVPLFPERLTLLPLRDPLTADAVTPLHAAAIAGLLHQCREAFDVVLIDAGPWRALPPVLRQVSIADACVWIQRSETEGFERSSPAGTAAAGIDVLGVVETFAPPVREPSPTMLPGKTGPARVESKATH
ncbi:MAG: hypothetical protein EXS05_13275 [Planctomycetaceae bacterium]|nr:hypothetical protein [Planctomycetaceae bacterium]